MKKNYLVTAAAIAVASAAVATPSYAVSFPLANVYAGSDSSNYWWWEDASELSFYGLWNDMWSNSGDIETWDDTGAKLWGSDHITSQILECADPADLSDAADGSDDQILTCDPQLIDNNDGELSVVSELRFYEDGQTLRERFIFTNDGTEPVDGQVLWVNFNAYQDNRTFVNWANGEAVGTWDPAAWSEDDYVTNELDYTWVTDDREAGQNSAVVKYAVGRAGSAVSLLNSDDFSSGGHGGSDNSNSYFELPSIAAGETVEIVVLTKVYLFDDEAAVADGDLSQWETNTRDTAVLAQTETALESDAIVYAGISDRTLVLNWTPQEADEDPNLAETGFDASPLGLVSAFAFAAGAVFVLRRRVTR